MNSRQRILAAANNQPTDKTPIWVMRQAGRYLPEYRKLKETYSFVQLAQTPELATEVTLQPLKRFPLDAAILFSDILVIPEAMGQPYAFRETGGIEMVYRLDSAQKIDELSTSEIPLKLDYVEKAIKLTRQELGEETALLGFAGSPWTLATYMVEGGSSKDFELIKSLVYQEPKRFEMLMEKIVVAVIDYLKMKIAAGVDAVQIFDSWGAIVPGIDYWETSLKYIKQIIDALPESFPVIVYAKGMGVHVDSILKTGAKVVSLDWTVDLAHVKANQPGNFAVQGNLDPVVLNTEPAIVKEAALKILNTMKPHTGHIFNLGHGILPTAKIENMETLVQTVTEF